GRAGGVLQQSVHPLGRVASPPAAHGEHALAHSPRHLDRANTLASQKRDLRPPYDLLRRVAISRQTHKPLPIFRRNLDAFDLAHKRQTRILTPIWESSDASGTLVRHLVLPNRIAGSEEVVRFVAEEVSP